MPLAGVTCTQFSPEQLIFQDSRASFSPGSRGEQERNFGERWALTAQTSRLSRCPQPRAAWSPHCFSAGNLRCPHRRCLAFEDVLSRAHVLGNFKAFLCFLYSTYRCSTLYQNYFSICFLLFPTPFSIAALKAVAVYGGPHIVDNSKPSRHQSFNKAMQSFLNGGFPSLRQELWPVLEEWGLSPRLCGKQLPQARVSSQIPMLARHRSRAVLRGAYFQSVSHCTVYPRLKHFSNKRIWILKIISSFQLLENKS